MPGYFGVGAFAELERALHDAAKWLASRGANTSVGRVGSYMRTMRELVVAHEAGNATALTIEHANALYEAHDLISMHRAFEQGPYADLVAARILKACSGPVLYRDENLKNASNAARNFAFELLVAERLIVGGASPHFPAHADVGLSTSSAELGIQCKRIFASIDSGSVRRNFKDAEVGLQGAKDAGARGIIAVDITRAANPQFLIPRAGGREEVRTRLLEASQNFINSNSRLWNQHKPGTIALLTRVTALIETDDAMFTHAQQYSLTPLNNISDEEDAMVNEFSSVLAAAAAVDGRRSNATTNAFKA